MRATDWDSILYREVEKATTIPFEWGKCDCCLWVADVVNAMTGVDHAEPLRGLYTDKQGAANALHNLDCDSLTYYVTTQLGDPLKSINLAQRGDVLLRIIDGQETLGIHVGNGIVVKDSYGVEVYPLSDFTVAWRIE